MTTELHKFVDGSAKKLGVARMKSGLKITQFKLENFMPSKAFYARFVSGFHALSLSL